MIVATILGFIIDIGKVNSCLPQLFNAFLGTS